ncbi:MAG: organoarsenical effux MFS transporter ArsJ [Granulosicoccus sp.]
MKDIPQQQELRGYAVVTVAYWSFMLTDGALRMLVLLHFHTLGFSPILLAYLFVLYEIMGMVTNILAGWLGTRYGLRLTLIAGLALQIASLLLLSALDTNWSVSASVVFVMLVQALSGVAKDLTKTSAKSAVKQLASNRQSGTLFRWVAVLTGSKNAVKGLGFFLGGLLLALSGFKQAVLIMAGCLGMVFIVVCVIGKLELGATDSKVRLREVWFTSQSVRTLSSARVFLFGARDTWFVVAIPVYLHTVFTQTFSLNAQQAFFMVGAFLSVWVMGYGFVQAKTPQWLSSARQSSVGAVKAVKLWSAALFVVMLVLSSSTYLIGESTSQLVFVVITGLLIFGVVFAMVSSLHSYLILALTTHKRSTMDVGFYYMSNAAGRLLGTLLSGLSYQFGGLALCLATAATMTAASWWFARALSQMPRQV